MTREEAIEQLQSLLEFSGTYVGRLCISAETHEAVKLVLNTLRPITREQVVKMRGEWVQVAYELAHLKCSECNHSINRFYGVSEFCPSCGAPMTDKAVDILWKRLEGNLNV